MPGGQLALRHCERRTISGCIAAWSVGALRPLGVASILSPIAAIDLMMRLIGSPNRLGSGEDMSMPSDLPDLWRQRQEVGAALDSGLLAADDPAWERFPDLDEAIREARPTDPAGLAIQMRLLADEFAASGHVADEKLALRIATVLEELG
jgi:hypothetical protein